MKLENISKIFGVLASIGFVLVILRLVGVLGDLNQAVGNQITNMILVMPVVFLLAAILTTLKRIAHHMEGSGPE
jgi:hypothetical protein